MDPLEEILGASAPMEALKDRVRHFLRTWSKARRPLPVLIQGATGTGKGLLARVLHRASPRANGPFVDLNCAAVPETLVESELFGFERGAFTDARQSKPGLIQLADGGTLFLDEIGLLSLAVQAKLLSALEDRAVRRLGGTRAQPVDVWIITATNEVLTEAVERGAFRQDLYYRLAALAFEMPPLRERGDDLLLLAEQFLARACADYGLVPKTLTPEARAALRAYPWPGNVRELGNVIERAAVLADAERLTAAHLAMPSVRAPREEPVVPPAGEASPFAPGPARDTMREQLLSVLTQNGWNISRTATALGISRNTVKARIARYRLRDPRDGYGTERASPMHAAFGAARATPARPIITGYWQPRRLGLLMVRVTTPAVTETTSRDVLASVADKILSFGGRLDGVSPSGLCGIFGLSPADEPMVLTAHCAMVIRQALRHLPPDDVSVMMGVHGAELLVDPGRDTPTLDAVGARAAWGILEALLARSDPGAVLVTEAAAALLRRRFTLWPLDDGSGYRMEGLWRAGPSRPRWSADLVDRREELALLEGRLGLASRGLGQMIDVAAEAGIGKSRLLLELATGKLAEHATYLEGRCSPASVSTPYYPLLSIIRDACSITEAHAADVVRARVMAAVQDAGAGASELTDLLVALLTTEAGAGPDMDPEVLKKRTFAAIRQLLIGRSRAAAPLLVAVEDLHWVDPTSEECLASLVERLGAASILLVSTYRVGYHPPWAGRSNVTRLVLPPLSPDDSRDVVQSVIAPGNVPDEIVDKILGRAEGNPLFLEELSRAALEHREGPAAHPVPETIEEVITLRMGRLRPRLRHLLGVAAVIGREAPLSLLRSVSELADQALEDSLEQLARGDFLFETGFHVAESGYSFKHALVHEVAYASLAASERAALHRRVVDAIEKLHPDRLSDYFEQLARHARLAADWPRAIKYLLQAGQKASTRSALTEAITHLSSGLELLPHLPEDGEHDRLELTFQTALGIVLRASRGSGVPETERAFARARELCERVGDDLQLGPIIVGQWASLLVAANYRGAQELASTLLALAERNGDPLVAAFGHRAMGMTAVHQGDFVTAREHLERGLARFRADEHHAEALRNFGAVPDISCLAYLGRTLWSLGYPDQALERSRQALVRAQEREGALDIATAMTMLTSVHQLRREPQQTRATTERALAYSREHGVTWWLVRNSLLLSWATAMEAGASEREAAVADMRQSMEEYRRTGTKLGLSWFSALLAQTHGAAGQPLAGLEVLDEALAHIAETGEGYHEAEILCLKGELLLMSHAPFVEAEDAFRRGLEVARAQQATGWELRVAIAYAGFLRDRGRAAEARDLLAPLRGWFTEGVDSADLRQARALLAELGAVD
jgi:DNA-binding NtrC family response regulator/tetratricopeptide (TPR) repeat protein